MDSELSWSVLAGFHRPKDLYGSLLIEKNNERQFSLSILSGACIGVSLISKFLFSIVSVVSSLFSLPVLMVVKQVLDTLLS